MTEQPCRIPLLENWKPMTDKMWGDICNLFDGCVNEGPTQTPTEAMLTNSVGNLMYEVRRLKGFPDEHPNGSMRPEDGEAACDFCNFENGHPLPDRKNYRACVGHAGAFKTLQQLAKKKRSYDPPKPACPDYGEPWRIGGTPERIQDSRGHIAMLSDWRNTADRVVLCVNACQGITNKELKKRIADESQKETEDSLSAQD